MTRKVAIAGAVVAIALVGGGLAAARLTGSCPFSCSASNGQPAAGEPTGRHDLVMAVACQRGCAKHDVPEGAVFAAQPGAVPGQLTRCPVSGVPFVVTEDGATVVVAGKTYRACCETCTEKLRAEPSRFLHL